MHIWSLSFGEGRIGLLLRLKKEENTFALTQRSSVLHGIRSCHHNQQWHTANKENSLGMATLSRRQVTPSVQITSWLGARLSLSLACMFPVRSSTSSYQ